MSAEELRRGDRHRARRRRVQAPARRRAVSSTTSTCSRSSAANRASSRSAASACPTATSSSSRRCARSSRRCACAPEPTVPCNNDLLAENFIDVGGELRLIDYEYSGNNEPCFELGNIWSESNLSLEQLEELVAHYYGRPLRNKVARARAVGPDVEVRLDALGLDPGRDLRPRLRLLGLGDGEVRPRGRGVRRAGVRAVARGGSATSD